MLRATPCSDHFGSNCWEIIKLMPNPIKVLKSAKRSKGCHCERRENWNCKWHQAHWFCQRSAHVLKIETKAYFPSWNFANYWRCWGLMNQQCQTAGSQTLVLHFNSLPCRQIHRRDGFILQVPTSCIVFRIFFFEVKLDLNLPVWNVLSRSMLRLNLVYLSCHIALSMLLSSWRFWET